MPDRSRRGLGDAGLGLAGINGGKIYGPWLGPEIPSRRGDLRVTTTRAQVLASSRTRMGPNALGMYSRRWLTSPRIRQRRLNRPALFSGKLKYGETQAAALFC